MEMPCRKIAVVLKKTSTSFVIQYSCAYFLAPNPLYDWFTHKAGLTYTSKAIFSWEPALEMVMSLARVVVLHAGGAVQKKSLPFSPINSDF